MLKSATDNSAGLSMRMERDWDLAPDKAPNFDHIPTEEGRDAARKLWGSAFGAPRQHVNRFDVLFGFATLRPDLAVKVVE